MKTARNFFRSWQAAARDRNFFEACREQWIWPHQVGDARTPYDLAQLYEEWFEEVRELVYKRLDAYEEQKYGNVRGPEDIPLPEDDFARFNREIRVAVFFPPHIINVGRCSSYMFVRTKKDGRDVELKVTTSRHYSNKPGIVQKEISLEELNLGQLHDLRTLLLRK